MKFLCFLVLSISFSAGSTNWANYARFEKFNDYFLNLMQELIYEMESHGWWNFQLNDQTIDIDQLIYDRHFQGPATYNNGFLVSVEQIKLTDASQSFTTGSSFTTTGSMVGTLQMISVVIGYDVSADFGELGVHKMTGIFNYPNVDFSIRVAKNLNTSAMTTTASVSRIAVGSGNMMTYLPDTDIGEVLSRQFLGASTMEGFSSWGTQFIGPTLGQIIDKIGFPVVCFNCE